MSYAYIAIAVISAATTAYTQIEAGESARRVGNYNKAVADNNALDAAQRGAVEASEHREKVRRMIATQNVAYSAAGVDASTGTAAAIQEDTAGFGELDALRILNNAQRGAAGARSQGDLEAWKGNSASRTGGINAAGSVLGSASSSYLGGKNAKLW